MPTTGARIFAWAGAALFAGSLLYFLYTYFVTFAETPAGAPHTAVAVGWDVLLFSVFSLHHSVFARDRVRRWVTRHVSPYLERSVYVWIASLLFIGVCAAWVPVAGRVWNLEGLTAWAVGGVQVLGIWLTLRSAVAIDAFELAGVRQVSSDAAARALSGRRGEPDEARPTGGSTDRTVGSSAFKTAGPYGWVRHPIYLGWCLVVFAVPAMTMTRMVFAVTSSAYLLLAIPFEERSLLAAAGDGYRDYMRRVPWRLLPRVY